MDFAIADLEKNKKALAEKQALFLCFQYEIATTYSFIFQSR